MALWKETSLPATGDPMWISTTPRGNNLQVTDMLRLLEHQPARYMWIVFNHDFAPIAHGHAPTLEQAEAAAVLSEQNECTR